MTKKNVKIMAIINILLIIAFIGTSILTFIFLRREKLASYHEFFFGMSKTEEYFEKFDDFSLWEITQDMVDFFNEEYSDTLVDIEYPLYGVAIYNKDGEIIAEAGHYTLLALNDERDYIHELYEKAYISIGSRENYEYAIVEVIAPETRWRNLRNTTSSRTDIMTFNDGRKYGYASYGSYNVEMSTLVSYEFRLSMLFQTLYYFVLCLIANITLVIYFKKARKLEDSKIAFTSAAAHELKTPLAVIENQCECILENIAPEKNNDYVKSIYSESLRMNKLVATLLQYNRLASAESIKKEKCDLTEIVKAEIEKYAPLMESKDIQLETSIAQSEIVISCNKDLIALVIDNYLSNAVKHTAEGKKITVTLSGNVNDFTLSVFNEGKNIKPELVKNLWDIFYRDDEARNSEDHSTGMGLAICKQILEHHKYKYGFTNKPNGVEFYFKNN